MRYIPFAILATLAGCGTTPAQQAQLVTAGQTLASVAAANDTTVAALVTKGNLFCNQASLASPLVVALADIYGAPVSVIGKSDEAVKTACALVGGIPVAPPADPAIVPVVASGTTLPTA